MNNVSLYKSQKYLYKLQNTKTEDDKQRYLNHFNKNINDFIQTGGNGLSDKINEASGLFNEITKRVGERISTLKGELEDTTTALENMTKNFQRGDENIGELNKQIDKLKEQVNESEEALQTLYDNMGIFYNTVGQKN